MSDNIDDLLHDTFRDVAGDVGLVGVREVLTEDKRNLINYWRKVKKSYIMCVRISRN